MPSPETLDYEGVERDLFAAAASFFPLQASKTSSRLEGSKPMPPAPTLEREKVAASPAPSAPMTVETARAMIAKVDAAEAKGVEMSDENMRALGFVETAGGTMELPIPVEILRQL